MKRLTNISCLALLCTAIACNDAATNNESLASNADSSTATTTNETVQDETPMIKDSTAYYQAWQTYATPGEPHAMMAKDNGTWNAKIVSRMAPDGPADTSMGTATNTMIMGGRYQQSTFRGNFGGMPFQGISTLGYDNAKKKYVNTWMDNMGTGIMMLEGTYDSTNKVLNLSGKGTDIRNGKDVTMRQTYKWVDDKTQHMEMFCTYSGGKEYKSMEVTYTKK